MEMPRCVNWFARPGNYELFMEWVFENAGTDWRLQPVAANARPALPPPARRRRDELHTLQVFTVHRRASAAIQCSPIPRLHVLGLPSVS